MSGVDAASQPVVPQPSSLNTDTLPKRVVDTSARPSPTTRSNISFDAVVVPPIYLQFNSLAVQDNGHQLLEGGGDT